MTDEQLQRLLQSALPRLDRDDEPRDAWPVIVERIDARPAWSLIDSALAAAVITALLIVPEWLFLLALHL